MKVSPGHRVNNSSGLRGLFLWWWCVSSLFLYEKKAKIVTDPETSLGINELRLPGREIWA